MNLYIDIERLRKLGIPATMAYCMVYDYLKTALEAFLTDLEGQKDVA